MAKAGHSYQRLSLIVSVARVSNLCLIEGSLPKYYLPAKCIFK